MHKNERFSIKLKILKTNWRIQTSICLDVTIFTKKWFLIFQQIRAVEQAWIG